MTLPGDDGERTVLAHHADSIISIREGELRFRDVEENWHEAIVGLGFAEMINNRLTILVDTAERPEDIDRKRAEEAKARAEEQLRQKQSMQEYYMSKASLARAMTRLSATNKKNIVYTRTRQLADRNVRKLPGYFFLSYYK